VYVTLSMNANPVVVTKINVSDIPIVVEHVLQIMIASQVTVVVRINVLMT
jgi:hypothetical protein